MKVCIGIRRESSILKEVFYSNRSLTPQQDFDETSVSSVESLRNMRSFLNSMLKNILKILVGVVLLPFCAGFTWQFGESVFGVAYKPGLPYYFLAGGLAYLTVHLLFKKPILTYVFGHELTHALFAVLFGGSVKSFQAGERGGRVTVTKSNFVITLAPYFFPLYTSVALLFYGVAAAADASMAAGWTVFFVGATFSFHIILTFVFLQEDQSDIREQGAFFSYPLIYLFNIVFAAMLLHVILARNAGFLGFLGGGIMKSVHMISRVTVKLYVIVRGML